VGRNGGRWVGTVRSKREWRVGMVGGNGGQEWWVGMASGGVTIKLCIHMITYWSRDQGERWAGCFYATSYAYNGI